MLFWAVDNPLPANYLLISGDRDFSNALHQLRMRRYNILIAQPPGVSQALVAAAKTVWLLTSLLIGGSPLPDPTPIINESCGNNKKSSAADKPCFNIPKSAPPLPDHKKQKNYNNGKADPNNHKNRDNGRNADFRRGGKQNQNNQKEASKNIPRTTSNENFKGQKSYGKSNASGSVQKNGAKQVQSFLSSVDRHNAISASQSRYQAAIILKKSCMKENDLGKVLQLLYVIIQVRKWIVPHSSGWQPLSFSISVDSNVDASEAKETEKIDLNSLEEAISQLA